MMDKGKLDNGGSAKDRNNSMAGGSEAEFNGSGGTNSNGNLNLSELNATLDEMNPCLRTFKACCKKKADFGLEDLFWILFLILIIVFSVVKSVSRIGWSQWAYLLLGSIVGLIAFYVVANLFNKFVLEDSSTAHWNAHARFTQAAIQSRIKEEEQRVHVIAPPKMGGAKLNIIYTVGDVPLVKPGSGGFDGASCKQSRHASSGSLGLPNALVNLTQQTLSTAAAALIPPTALDKTTPTIAPSQPIQHILQQEMSSSAPTTPPSVMTGSGLKSFSPPHRAIPPDDIIEEEEPSRVLESPASLSELTETNDTNTDNNDHGGTSHQQHQSSQMQTSDSRRHLPATNQNTDKNNNNNSESHGR